MNPALPTVYSTNGSKTFFFQLLDSEAVQKKLSSLNVWKSIGLDGFSDHLLKECGDWGNSPPLLHVFKCSLQSGVFSTVWKLLLPREYVHATSPRTNSWFESQTSFNASKTVHMLFRQHHRHHTVAANPSPVLLLNSIKIPHAESTRHLGVMLTGTLSWSEHISNIIQRQQFKIFVLKRLARRRGSEDVVKRLYVGVVCPAFGRLRPLGWLSEVWSHRTGTCPASYCTLWSSRPLPPRSPQLGGAETTRLAHPGVVYSSQEGSVLVGSAE